MRSKGVAILALDAFARVSYLFENVRIHDTASDILPIVSRTGYLCYMRLERRETYITNSRMHSLREKDGQKKD
jgi:hypothetical protein